MVMNRAFSARNSYFGCEPRALPWAGMNDAFGVDPSEQVEFLGGISAALNDMSGRCG